MVMNRVASVIAVLGCYVLSSCSQGVDRIEESMNAAEIMKIAENYVSNEDYQYGAEVFMEVDRLHRYSDSARKSLISASRAFHMSGDYENCRFSSNRFLEDFPESRQAAQAKYLIGLCYYEQIPDISRDQRPAKEALREFSELIEEYPSSDFVPRAREKFDEALAQIAGQELEIGKFYLEKKQVLAAISRFLEVVDKYKMTPYHEEGLFRVFEAYTLIGLVEKSKVYHKELIQLYPESFWLTEANNIKSF